MAVAIRRRRNKCETAGRIVGATGAIGATALWALLGIFSVAMLIDPGDGLESIGAIVALPLGVISAMLFVFSAADFIILVRRVDTDLPSRIAAVHGILAVAMLWLSKGGSGLIPFGVLFAITATQIIALRLFQMTPSHALSQR